MEQSGELDNNYPFSIMLKSLFFYKYFLNYYS